MSKYGDPALPRILNVAHVDWLEVWSSYGLFAASKVQPTGLRALRVSWRWSEHDVPERGERSVCKYVYTGVVVAIFV
jgi:hypothetical protein